MDRGKKNGQIAFITAFAIILVVIGHADMTPAYNELWIKKWIYSFHMPLFVFVSGFLFCYTTPNVESISLKFFLLKKAKRLLLPFLAINTIIFLIKTRFGNNDYVQHPVTMTVGSYIDSMLFHPIGFMWFLPALFVIFLIVAFIAKQVRFTKEKYLTWLLLVVLFFVFSHFVGTINFMQISTAIYYVGFFIFGIIYCLKKEYLDTLLLKCRFLTLLVLFSISALVLKYAIVAALIGILFALSLSLVIGEKFNAKIVLFSNFSFTIYLLSYFPQMLIRGPIFHRFPEVNEYVFSFCSIMLGLFIPLLIGNICVKMKNKNSLTNFFINLIGL